jgi:hypothetical protein
MKPYQYTEDRKVRGNRPFFLDNTDTTFILSFPRLLVNQFGDEFLDFFLSQSPPFL